MTQSKPDRNGMHAQAQKVEALIRARGEYAHIHVRANRGHLIIESRQEHEPSAVARLTPLGTGLFGLSFCRHDRRWEKMPFNGTVEQVVSDLIETLAPYLQRMDFPDFISGTRH